jgi:hypothetical protein
MHITPLKPRIALILFIVVIFSSGCKKENNGKPKYYFNITVDGKNTFIEYDQQPTSGNEDYTAAGIYDNGASIVAHKQCKDGVNPECFDVSFHFNGTKQGSYDTVNLTMSMFKDSISYEYNIQPHVSNELYATVQVTDIQRSIIRGQVGYISGKLSGTAWDPRSPDFVPITIVFRVPHAY